MSIWWASRSPSLPRNVHFRLEFFEKYSLYRVAGRYGTWRNKLGDNLRDWSARFQGKFRNECGDHAGFSKGELTRMLAKDYQQQRWVTRQYLQYKYLQHRFAPAVSLFTTGPIQNIAAPSIYVFAKNK